MSIFGKIIGLPDTGSQSAAPKNVITDPFAEDSFASGKARKKGEDDLDALFASETPAAPTSKTTSTSASDTTPPETREIRRLLTPFGGLFLVFYSENTGLLTLDDLWHPLVEKFGSNTAAYQELRKAVDSGELEAMITFGRYAAAQAHDPDEEIGNVDFDSIITRSRIPEDVEGEIVKLLTEELEAFAAEQDRAVGTPVAVTTAPVAMRTKEDFLADCEGLDADGLQFFWEVIGQDFHDLPKPEQSAALGAYMACRSKVADSKAIDTLFRKK